MLTAREKELLAALEAAIATFEFASMTRYEREACAADMKKARDTRDKFAKEKKK